MTSSLIIHYSLVCLLVTFCPVISVDLPKKIELKTPGGPEISKFEKRKKKAKSEKITVFQDAANSCCIGEFHISFI